MLLQRGGHFWGNTAALKYLTFRHCWTGWPPWIWVWANRLVTISPEQRFLSLIWKKQERRRRERYSLPWCLRASLQLTRATFVFPTSEYSIRSMILRSTSSTSPTPDKKLAQMRLLLISNRTGEKERHISNAWLKGTVLSIERRC